MRQNPIFTIGCENRDLQSFLTLLKAHDVAYLIDVRSRPDSRRQPAFSKAALVQALKTAGIRYVFMGDTLGGRPDDPACYTNGTANYDKATQRPFFRQGIGRLQKAHAQQHRVALMCAEASPEQCRRTHLIGRSLAALDIPVLHIDEAGKTITQTQALARLQNGQMGLFDVEKKSEAPETAVPPPPPLPFDDEMLPYEPPPVDDETADALYAFDDLPPVETGLPDLTPLPAHDGPMTVAAAQKLLKQIFGYDDFRPLQAEIIAQLLAGQDALAIMPTGSGKSLCYQLPALMFPGLTVVVSPLISLMEDQVMQLRELGVTAVALNSALSPPEYSWAVQQIRAGRVKLLYVAPETLVRPQTMALLHQARVNCFTIDEAHCISEWGHDFRPEYRQLSEVRRALPDAVCLAVTATATERVRRDIQSSLDIAASQAFIASFNRENLFLAVEPKTDVLAQTTTFLDQHRDESGIIYCATRRQVDELAAQLQARGWRALPYHAGLDDHTRADHQRQFSRDDAPIIVATIAFGMGINKSNVRFILHVDLPKNLESYYQQIGRAGRDGLRADCLLLYGYGDVNTINFFISQQHESQQIGARMRLEAMLGFVESNGCRRRPLLTYFDEPYDDDNCDMCDNCTLDADRLVDLTVPAQKFLSCVKRTGEMFGVNHIIDVLRGSQSQKVIGRNHHRLSTYNIGDEFSKKEWQYLARQFVQQGLLQQDMEYGSLKLTPQAYAVLRGEETVMGTMMQQPRRVTTVAAPHDAALFDQLRAHRKALADAANLPPYTVFSDRTLVEMATYFPQSRAAFAQLYGVGEAKLASYAHEFLPIIRAYCAEKGIAEKPKMVTAVPSGGGGGRREEVVAMWNDGRSLPDLASHFQIKEKTIIDHLWKAVQAGDTLRSDNLLAHTTLSEAAQQRALAAFAAHGPDYLRPVYEALNETVSYDDLHLVRLHYALSAQKS